MSQVIKIKRSETSSSAPSTSDLAHEIAMNVADQKIYTKNASGSIVVVASHAEASGITEADALALAIALG